MDETAKVTRSQEEIDKEYRDCATNIGIRYHEMHMFDLRMHALNQEAQALLLQTKKEAEEKAPPLEALPSESV